VENSQTDRQDEFEDEEYLSLTSYFSKIAEKLKISKNNVIKKRTEKDWERWIFKFEKNYTRNEWRR
jgi:hypothetical protein